MIYAYVCHSSTFLFLPSTTLSINKIYIITFVLKFVKTCNLSTILNFEKQIRQRYKYSQGYKNLPQLFDCKITDKQHKQARPGTKQIDFNMADRECQIQKARDLKDAIEGMEARMEVLDVEISERNVTANGIFSFFTIIFQRFEQGF